MGMSASGRMMTLADGTASDFDAVVRITEG